VSQWSRDDLGKIKELLSFCSIQSLARGDHSPLSLYLVILVVDYPITTQGLHSVINVGLYAISNRVQQPLRRQLGVNRIDFVGGLLLCGVQEYDE